MKYIYILILLYSFKVTGQDCKGIEKKIDDFEDKVTYSPAGLNNVSVFAFTENKATKYYLSIKTTGATLNLNESGVYLLMSDGQKIIRKEEKIDVEYESGKYYGPNDYEYSAFFSLTKDEMEYLSKVSIKKFRLYIYDQDISEEKQNMQIENIKCLLKMTN